MAPTNPPLARFVDRLIETRFDTASALAEAIGMSLSAFSRGIREEGSLSVENCLRLAAVTGERPGKVLRLAGRPELAEVTDQLFGTEITSLNKREQEHLKLWRTVDSTAHDAIDALLQTRVLPATPSGSGRDRGKKKTDKRRTKMLKARRFPAGSGAAEPRLRA